MKNILVLSLLFASTVVVTAQIENQNSDLGVGLTNWNNPVDDVVAIAGPPAVNTEERIIDSTNTSAYDNNSTMESFVSLHLNVVGLTTQTPMDAAIDIYRNSDFIKDYAGKVENGAFNIHLKDFGWYIISLSAPGYFEASDTVWIVSEKRKTIDINFYMIPIGVGMHVANNINFNFGKTILPEQSLAELDKEVIFLNENPNVIFEIAGHTDSDGPKAYNLLLSQRRAQAVVDYLISQGVEGKQLIARGYGGTRPLNSNETQADKATNRRVVFTVLTMDSTAVAKQQIKNDSPMNSALTVI